MQSCSPRGLSLLPLRQPQAAAGVGLTGSYTYGNICMRLGIARGVYPYTHTCVLYTGIIMSMSMHRVLHACIIVSVTIAELVLDFELGLIFGCMLT